MPRISHIIATIGLAAGCAARAPKVPALDPLVQPPWPLVLDEHGQTRVALSTGTGETEWIVVHQSSVSRLLDPAGCLAANLEFAQIVVEQHCSQLIRPGSESCAVSQRHRITVRVEGYANAGTVDELDPRERAAREGLFKLVTEALVDVEQMDERGVLYRSAAGEDCLPPCVSGPSRGYAGFVQSKTDEREAVFWSSVLAPGCPTPRELRLGSPYSIDSTILSVPFPR